MVVRTTESGPSDEALAAYFSDSTIPVTVKRDAPWSYEQTLENIRDIEAALNGVVDEYLLYVNPREPKGITVSLRIPSDMSDATLEQLAALLPALVTDKSASLAWSDGPIFYKSDVYGGARTQKRGTNTFWCTTGFAVETSVGLTGLVTGQSPQGFQAGLQRPPPQIRSGSSGWVDRPPGWRAGAGTPGALVRSPSWAPKGSTVGNILEPGADLEPAPDRFPP